MKKTNAIAHSCGGCVSVRIKFGDVTLIEIKMWKKLRNTGPFKNLHGTCLVHTAKMNLKAKKIGNDIASKNNNLQRVSVIKWAGKESTKTSKEKYSFEKDCTVLVVQDKSSSCSVPAKYRCSFCKKSFKWHSHWKSHVRIHTGEKPFKCEICGKCFTRSDGLQCHKLTHITPRHISITRGRSNTQATAVAYTSPPGESSSERISNVMKGLEEKTLFNCTHCKRMFFSSAGVLKHLQVHEGKTSFICEVCDMVFSKKSALEVHSRVHTGIKPYRCNVCTKAFSIYGNLKRHLLIHTGERPYHCSYCLNSFNNPSHLRRHLKTKHKDTYTETRQKNHPC